MFILKKEPVNFRTAMNALRESVFTVLYSQREETPHMILATPQRVNTMIPNNFMTKYVI